VADPPLAERPPHARDHVVRGRADRFVDDQQAIHRAIEF
jgi:hypothetical protein